VERETTAGGGRADLDFEAKKQVTKKKVITWGIGERQGGMVIRGRAK